MAARSPFSCLMVMTNEARRESLSETVLRFDAAMDVVLAKAALAASNRRASERVALLEAAGRVLAEAIAADRDQPGFDRATRDGFAVRATEISAGAKLRMVGQVRAGERWSGPSLGADEAIEIMTGAPVPEGADAVVMVEHVAAADGAIRIAEGRRLRVGENIVPRGREAKAGAVVVAAGTRIGASEIALAASCGCDSVAVAVRPRVAILATGDELVEIGERPDGQQIRNSNSYGLAALVAAAGGEAVRLGIARDVREAIGAGIAAGRRAELLLLSGGVSMGKYDLVEAMLSEAGAEFFFTGVKMQPGKPLVFGRLPAVAGPDESLPECYFFGLPGNPISTEVTFRCFVEPFLQALAGGEIRPPRLVQATLGEAVEGKPGLMRLLPARLTSSLREQTVRLVAWQGSGDLAANARANCYAVLSDEREEFAAGDVIPVLLH